MQFEQIDAKVIGQIFEACSERNQVPRINILFKGEFHSCYIVCLFKTFGASDFGVVLVGQCTGSLTV